MTEYSPQWKEKRETGYFAIRDIEYFQGMYPQKMKELQKYVIQQCDAMDYEGSPIYDEYPDSLVIDQACRAVCQRLPREWTGEASDYESKAGTDQENGGWLEEEQIEGYEAGNPETEVEMMERRPGRPPQSPPPWGPPPGRPPQSPPPWGPPPGRPPQSPPPWGPPPGRPPQSPPPWGPPPGRPPQSPPPWGPPPGRPPQGPPQGGNWVSDVVKVLLMNELQRRRCQTGRC